MGRSDTSRGGRWVTARWQGAKRNPNVHGRQRKRSCRNMKWGSSRRRGKPSWERFRTRGKRLIHRRSSAWRHEENSSRLLASFMLCSLWRHSALLWCDSRVKHGFTASPSSFIHCSMFIPQNIQRSRPLLLQLSEGWWLPLRLIWPITCVRRWLHVCVGHTPTAETGLGQTSQTAAVLPDADEDNGAEEQTTFLWSLSLSAVTLFDSFVLSLSAAAALNQHGSSVFQSITIQLWVVPSFSTNPNVKKFRLF